MFFYYVEENNRLEYFSDVVKRFIELWNND